MTIKPVLKYAGGKRSLLETFFKVFPEEITGRFIGPTVGGGSVDFNCLERYPAPGAIIADVSPDIIQLYQTIQTMPQDFLDFLSFHEANHSEDHFYQQRDLYVGMTDPNEKSAAFLYMNKAGFNGLWRVNKSGAPTVPWGKRDEIRFNRESISELHHLFSNSNDLTFLCADFTETLSLATPGDFVYIDPPYLPVNDSGFVSYTKKGFSVARHFQLCEYCCRLDRLGVQWAVSGSDSGLYRNMFKRYNIREVTAARSIGCSPDSRIRVQELLVTNF